MNDTKAPSASGGYPPCKSSWVLAPDDFCGEPATVPVTVGCVHEHVRDSFACPEHAGDLDSHYCRSCWNDGDGHKCRLSLLAVAS
jgi:hypothetical protein